MKGQGKGFPRSVVLGVALIACALFPASAGAVSFFRTDVTVGTHPTSVAVGNFDGGAPDLAVANEDSDTVSILLGNGFGQFTPAAPVPVGSLPSSVVTGNFNGDAFTDLAVASVGNDSIAIKLGDGTGGFSGTGTVSTGTSSDPRAIAVGDFTNDSKADLVSANQGSSTVSVHLGDGMGAFATDSTPRDVSTGSSLPAANPIAIAVIQLGFTVMNPDTNLDVIVASQTSDQVLELLGDGTGEFPGAGTLYTSMGIPGSDPSAVAVGSLNPASPNPGNAAEPDMLTANQGVDQVWPAYGRTDGTFFDFGGVEPTGADPVALAIGDLDGDGDDDGITANRAAGTATVILSDGNGDVTADTSPAVGTAPSAVAAGAFDADARDDVAVANYNSNSVSLLTSLQPGPPAAAPPAPGPPAADPRCAALRKKLKKAKKAHNKAKVKKLRKRLRKLGCV
jgi:FG-GAP-like repeat